MNALKRFLPALAELFAKLSAARALASVLVLLFACTCTKDVPDDLFFEGRTMGTRYTIRISRLADVARAGKRPDPDAIQKRVQARLDSLEALMSTWKPDSELSRFNASRSTSFFKLSPETALVMKEALRVARLTDGAFDPTVGELVELWGFGRTASGTPPSPERIRAALTRAGFRRLTLKGDLLAKSVPDLTINLSAIAKGRAVDVVFEDLVRMGFSSVMVEIGGEVRVGAPRVLPTGDAGSPATDATSGKWRIGVEEPNYSDPGQNLHSVLELERMSLATSGDYRNFFTDKGKRFAHILNPATGLPARTGVVSATVIGKDCMTADALATAMLVMGHVKGLKLIESLPDYEALLLVDSPATPDRLQEFPTSGMDKFRQRRRQ